MVFAAIERNEWRRRLEESERRAGEECAEKEKERAAREAAEMRILELEKRLADSESRRG